MPQETRYNKVLPALQTADYYAAFVLLGLVSGSLGPTLPALAERTTTELGAIGVLFTAERLGYLIGSFQAGWIYDKVRGNRLMAILLVLLAVVVASIPTAHALWLLVLVVMLMGIFQGGIDVGGNTLLIWVHKDKVGPFMNGLHFFWGTGAFLAPIVVALAVQRSGDIAWAYWTIAICILPVAIWTTRLPSPIFVKRHVPDSARDANRTFVGLLAALWFLYIAMEVGFGGWVYSYAVTLGLSNPTHAAYLTSAFWGALTFGRLLTVPIATRFRSHTILLVALGLALASSSFLVLFGTQLIPLWAGTIGLGLALASVIPTSMSFAESCVPVTGRVTSWLFVGGSAGGMTVPWLMGRFFESLGPNFIMFAIAVDASLALAMMIVLLLYSKRPEFSKG